MVGQHLERHLAVEQGVESPPDHAHPAPAVALRRTATEGLLMCCAGLHAAAAVLAPLLAKAIAEAIQSGDRAPMDAFTGAFRAVQPVSPQL